MSVCLISLLEDNLTKNLRCAYLFDQHRQTKSKLRLDKRAFMLEELTYQRGTKTFDIVGALFKDTSPWSGKRFHVIEPWITS